MTIEKKGHQLGTTTTKKTSTYMGHGFLKIQCISPLLSSTLGETHSPKKILLDERGLKKRYEMILLLSSQSANIE